MATLKITGEIRSRDLYWEHVARLIYNIERLSWEELAARGYHMSGRTRIKDDAAPIVKKLPMSQKMFYAARYIHTHRYTLEDLATSDAISEEDPDSLEVVCSCFYAKCQKHKISLRRAQAILLAAFEETDNARAVANQHLKIQADFLDYTTPQVFYTPVNQRS